MLRETQRLQILQLLDRDTKTPMVAGIREIGFSRELKAIRKDILDLEKYQVEILEQKN